MLGCEAIAALSQVRSAVRSAGGAGEVSTSAQRPSSCRKPSATSAEPDRRSDANSVMRPEPAQAGNHEREQRVDADQREDDERGDAEPSGERAPARAGVHAPGAGERDRKSTRLN